MRRHEDGEIFQNMQPLTAMPQPQRNTLSFPHAVALVISALAGLIALTRPLAAHFPDQALPHADATLAVLIFTVGMWVCSVFPEALTTLIFFCIMMLGKLAPASTVFAGFTSSAFWLVFAGLILGLAVRESGLGNRIADWLGRLCRGSYFTTVSAMVGFGLVMSFLMPSAMGRVILMMPILSTFAEKKGYLPGSRGGSGILLAGAASTLLPAFTILPSNVGNMVLVGTMEALYGTVPTYGQYMLMNFPIMGLLKLVAITLLATALFREAPGQIPEERASLPPISRAERRLMLLLCAALLMWMTDAFHGISPAWVGLTAAVICLLPGTHLLAEGAFSRIGFAPLFYVAGVIGVSATVQAYDFGSLGAGAVLNTFPLTPGDTAWNYSVLSGVGIFANLLATSAGVPAVMSPMAGKLADASGLPLMTVLMTQVIGFSTVLLPYETPAIVVAAHISNVPTRTVNTYYAILFIVTVLLLLPLNYLWWGLIGAL